MLAPNFKGKKIKTKMSLTCMKSCFFLPFLLLFSLSFKAHPCRGSDTIFPGQSLSGNQTIRSDDGGTFELGFFTPGNSRNYYIGIWYGRLPTKTVVWVANRDQPLSDPSSSTLQLSHDGRLVLLNQSKTEIWSTDVNSTTPDSTIAVLLDHENLVVRGGTNSSSVVYWQSFDHPTDTWLPGGRIGYSKLTNEKMFLTAWSNPEIPAPGIFSSKVEVVQNGASHDLLWNHSKMYWSTGEWTGKNCKKEKIIFALNNFIESGDEDLYKRFPTIMLIYSRYKRQLNKYAINTIYFAIYN